MVAVGISCEAAVTFLAIELSSVSVTILLFSLLSACGVGVGKGLSAPFSGTMGNVEDDTTVAVMGVTLTVAVISKGGCSCRGGTGVVVIMGGCSRIGEPNPVSVTTEVTVGLVVSVMLAVVFMSVISITTVVGVGVMYSP